MNNTIAAFVDACRRYFRSRAQIALDPSKERAVKLLRSVQTEAADTYNLEIVDSKIRIPIEALQFIATTYADEIRLFAGGQSPLDYLMKNDSEIDMTEGGGILAPRMPVNS